ncbi:MAG TPA: hypothetical protein PLV03_02250 [Clostridiales bacterium]|nr:hypothetical protein [Clostridiales bacterium]
MAINLTDTNELKRLFYRHGMSASLDRQRECALEIVQILKNNITVDRLIELVEADKEGRIAVLPLKFDTDIYREGSSYSWQVSQYHVFPDEVVGFDDSDNAFTAKDIGVTVFTEPEAQAALERSEHHDGNV